MTEVTEEMDRVGTYQIDTKYTYKRGKCDHLNYTAPLIKEFSGHQEFS